MVLLCMITVVSPRLTLLEVVVMVRVTLHAVSITDSPIASPKDCLAAYKKTFRCATLTKNRSALLHFKKHNYTRMSGLISLSIRGPRKF